MAAGTDGPGVAMLRNLSSRSVAQSSASASLSAFDRELPKAVETLEVVLPRGLRVYASPRVAGRVRTTPSGSSRTRKYDVTVEPNAHSKRPKELLRELAKQPSCLDLEAELQEAADCILDQRRLFRRDRAKRFQVGSHFPALAAPRLVPSWRRSAARKSAETGSICFTLQPDGSASTSSLARRPTMSHCSKQRVKRMNWEAGQWHNASGMLAEQLICDRRPALYEGLYDTPRIRQQQEMLESKRRWVGQATILPTNPAVARVAFDSARLPLNSQVAAVRQRGRALNEDLKERYLARRQLFQNELQARGNLSSFEDFERRQLRAHAKATSLSVPAPPATEPEPSHLRLTLGGAFRPGQF